MVHLILFNGFQAGIVYIRRQRDSKMSLDYNSHHPWQYLSKYNKYCVLKKCSLPFLVYKIHLKIKRSHKNVDLSTCLCFSSG
ncbi:hypothetical protein GDO86_013260 [Hymenochirus boettgeri]|uniref:Uncharacterized protein n=1 Tax=Hymenochirus boettgeri TaxID=247094 RepID=A0A8T2IW01_9PIPI|nr:hypothetical protein GDO86_013260 [Hymenochirus boettgeri]